MGFQSIMHASVYCVSVNLQVFLLELNYLPKRTRRPWSISVRIQWHSAYYREQTDLNTLQNSLTPCLQKTQGVTERVLLSTQAAQKSVYASLLTTSAKQGWLLSSIHSYFFTLFEYSYFWIFLLWPNHFWFLGSFLNSSGWKFFS